jgi:predicted nuclease of predicted toxin-antitoxin system
VKFLLDVCVSSRSLETFLAGQGHDVLSAMVVDPRASDERLMALALQDERVLVTEDKDFGELVFVRKLPHGPIVRLVELTVDQHVSGMSELLERNAAEVAGPVIITITRGRIRIRRLAAN